MTRLTTGIVFLLLCAGAPVAADDSLVTDRPDFVESSRTVGEGVTQIETSVAWEKVEVGGLAERVVRRAAARASAREQLVDALAEFILDPGEQQAFRRDAAELGASAPATVEIGAHFLHSRLQLADVLRETQLPKNGLRFWFNDAEKSLPLREASEDGPITFAYWQSYQLDRESVEVLE